MLFRIQIVLKVRGIGSQHSIEAVEVNLVAALSVCWLDDDVVHHEVVLDIGGLVLLHLGLGNLPVVPSFSIVLVNKLNSSGAAQLRCFTHLDFSRSDLDRVRLSFVDSYGLVNCSLGGLPGRLLLSVKLFSNLGTSLENLGTYLLILLLIVFSLIDKGYCVPFIVKVHVVRLVA